MPLLDLSHVIEDGMITYRGLPAPVVCDFLTREASRAIYAPGTEFHIGRIEMVANTGTYLDSPFHRFADGKDLAALPLESLAELPGVVVHARGPQVTSADFRGLDVHGRAVLVHTGWDRHWRTDQYFEGHPHLTADAAAWLVEHGAALVGIDSLNIDDTGDGRRPVHTALLGAEIPIVEHLRGALPDRDFRFTAAPVKVRGIGTGAGLCSRVSCPWAPTCRAAKLVGYSRTEETHFRYRLARACHEYPSVAGVSMCWGSSRRSIAVDAR